MPFTTPVTCLLFDYGGTLDSGGRHWAHVLWDAYAAARIPVSHAQFREAYVFGERALAKAPLVRADDDFYALLVKKATQEIAWLQFRGYWRPDDAAAAAAAHAVADYCDRCARRHIDDSRTVLETLSERYRLVLVTNFYGNIGAILRAYRLPYFRHVVESAVVGVRKPDARLWQLGMDAVGATASETVVIGDSYAKDIVPAHSLGCRTIWLKGEGWTSGEEYDATVPDAIVSTLRDILPLLT